MIPGGEGAGVEGQSCVRAFGVKRAAYSPLWGCYAAVYNRFTIGLFKCSLARGFLSVGMGVCVFKGPDSGLSVRLCMVCVCNLLLACLCLCRVLFVCIVLWLCFPALQPSCVCVCCSQYGAPAPELCCATLITAALPQRWVKALVQCVCVCGCQGLTVVPMQGCIGRDAHPLLQAFGAAKRLTHALALTHICVCQRASSCRQKGSRCSWQQQRQRRLARNAHALPAGSTHSC